MADREADAPQLHCRDDPHPGGRGFGNILKQIESRFVLHAVAGFDCLDSDRDDQMGLTDSGLTDDQPAAALFDESAGGQIKDLLPVDRVVKGEVEVLQVLLFRELGLAQPALQQPVATAGQLVVNQQLKELLMAEPPLDGSGAGVRQRPGPGLRA